MTSWRKNTIFAHCPVKTMSPKAYRLVDQLSEGTEKNRAVSEMSEKPRFEKTHRAAESSAHGEKELADICCSAKVTEITPLAEEALLSITLLIRREEGLEVERHHIRLLPGQYATLKPLIGAVTMEMAEALLEAGHISRAIQKGMELLGYGAMSRRRLISKLTARGIDRACAEGAVDYLASEGYLSEDDAAMRFAEQGARKLWGPRRIREDLFARGFTSDVVVQVMEDLETVDFVESCATVIAKKYGKIPTDPAARRKMMAALMRLGYTSEQIREAMKRDL